MGAGLSIPEIVANVLGAITDVVLAPLRWICHNITQYLIDAGFPDDWSIPFGIIGKIARFANKLFCVILDYPYVSFLLILLSIGIYFIAGPPIPVLTSWIQWILD